MGKLAKVTDVTSAGSMAEVLTMSGTDYETNIIPAEIVGPDGRRFSSGGFQALVRADTGLVLGTVGERYRINDHRNHLMALDSFVSSGVIVPASVSMWDNGAVLAYQFRCPDLDVVIRDRDVVSPLLTLAFAYGFPLADAAFFSDFRWFCKNQMGQVAQLSKGFRVAHKGDVTNRFADVLGQRIGELSGELSDRYKAMRGMTSKPMRGRSLAEYFGQVIGASQADVDAAWVTPAEECKGDARKIHDIVECHAVESKETGETVWTAYNAVTRYQTHVNGRSEATRNRAMLLGTGSAMANRAWELAAAA